MSFRTGNEPLSFESAIEEETKRTSLEYKKMLDDENYFSDEFTVHAYRKKSLYHDFILNWMKYFPKEQFMFVKSESFFENPKKILNEVLDFLELPSITLPKYKIIRQGIYEKMDSHTRENLLSYFKPHNEKLYKLLHCDFEWENKIS